MCFFKKINFTKVKNKNRMITDTLVEEKKAILESKLKDIDIIIKTEYKKEEQLGVLSGLSGIALFQFYYSKYLDTDSNADVGVDIISNSIEKINDGYSFPTFCTGIAGLGWTLDHLEQEDFIDLDSDSLLSEFDEYLKKKMLSDFNNHNFDFLHGGIGYAFYFLNRYRNTTSTVLKEKYTKILFEFVNLLETSSEKDGENKIKWKSVLNIETKEKGYNLSLSHGISSIIGILTKLYEHDVFKTSTEHLLKGAINYVLSLENEDEKFCVFPNSKTLDGTISKKSRLAWCYGDLGVGIRLWFAGKVLSDEELKDKAISIFKHAAGRTKKEDSMVLDAAICHGSYGNAQIFNRMYKETGIIEFKNAASFWMNDGLAKGTFEDGFAGYKQWRGAEKQWGNEINLLEGIAGIGLVIIDHLSSFDTKWDECLMIS